MKTPLAKTRLIQAAEVLLQQLSGAEPITNDTHVAMEEATQQEVQELSGAAAAVVFTARQVLPPSRPAPRLPEQSEDEKR